MTTAWSGCWDHCIFRKTRHLLHDNVPSRVKRPCVCVRTYPKMAKVCATSKGLLEAPKYPDSFFSFSWPIYCSLRPLPHLTPNTQTSAGSAHVLKKTENMWGLSDCQTAILHLLEFYQWKSKHTFGELWVLGTDCMSANHFSHDVQNQFISL